MHTRQLGKTDFQITLLGLGTWAMGGDWAAGWGEQDDKESLATIHRALELGINWIDTAAVYGLGHSEELVGQALKEWRGERPYVFTKCSLIWNEKGKVGNSLKEQSLRRELEDSLRRLQVDVIDLYQIHWPNPDEDIEEGWSTLAKFKQEGKVREIGVSNFNVSQMKRVQAIAPIASLQPPYSLIKRDVEHEILDYCQEQQIGVIVYSPMMSGLLTGTMSKESVARLPHNDWRRRDEEFQEPRLSRNLELASVLQDLGYPHSRSAGEVAIGWVLQHPAVTGAIVGGRRPKQIEDMVGAAEFRLSESERAEIEKFLQEHP